MQAVSQSAMTGLRRSLAVAKKNAMIYYLKPPVLIFGVLFPVFMFLAFAVGRDVPRQSLAPGLIAMTILFTASSVGPMIAPWERKAKTYERLLSAPLSIFQLVLGDILAGFIYGLLISLVPLLLSIFTLGAHIEYPLFYAAGLILSAFCFAALGALMAALPTEEPSMVMMLSNLVRIPLLFISGVFIPINQMPVWGQKLAMLSPLSYTSDLMRLALGHGSLWGGYLNFAALLFFIAVFLQAAVFFHRRGIVRVF